jgi:hypothetical protein
MIRLIGCLFILGLFACKGDNKEHIDVNNIEPVEDEYQFNYKRDVPDILPLLSKEKVEEYLGLKSGDVYRTVPNNGSAGMGKSVFYNINDPDLGNAAIMIQVTANPAQDLISDKEWASLFVNNKLNEGERSLNKPGESTRFNDWEVGLAGAYNTDVGKYFWRDKNNHVYFLAFNTTLTANQQLKAAEKIAKHITPEE